jgi:endonuclease/exonuclease/phosphatase family metal-dependent hydrolase
MKHVSATNWILPTLMLSLSIAASIPLAAAPTLRVLTYNIHHGEGTDGRVDLSRLAEVVSAVDPDLVALQEVDEGTERVNGVSELAELARLTHMHPAFGKAMNYLGGQYGVAILSRWPLLHTDNDPLPNSPEREPRTALTVEVEMGAYGPRLEFTSTHLDQTRDPQDRLAQARSLNARHVHENGQATILAGDLNARTGTDVMDLFDERWTDPPAIDPSPIAPSGRPRSRVDHVLIRPTENWRVIESRLIDDAVASDHRPLLVVLEWTGPR